MTAKVFLITVLAVVVFVLQTGTAKGDVIRDGLVSYWTFDKADVVGKKVKDVVGKFGEAIELHGPGTNGDHVKVSSLDPSPPSI